MMKINRKLNHLSSFIIIIQYPNPHIHPHQSCTNTYLHRSINTIVINNSLNEILEIHLIYLSKFIRDVSYKKEKKYHHHHHYRHQYNYYGDNNNDNHHHHHTLSSSSYLPQLQVLLSL